MPKYFYGCKECDSVLTFYHSMNETKEDCTECSATKSLVRKPSLFVFQQHENNNKKIGQVVKESIEEFKEDLEIQKEELKTEYGNE